NISASGLLNLDFELDNKSNTGTTFNIVSVTATDALANNILGSFNNTSTSVSPGLTSRTGASGPSISLNLPASIDYPFTIDAQVQVNDGTTSYISTLRYIINSPQSNPINGFLDQRFAVSSKVNVIDPGIINNPSLTAPVISAYMVDDSGSTIAANSGVEGFLKIQSGSKSYHLAIDSLDSKHNGDAPTNQLATGLKFSAFFGLNDLFVRTDSGLNSLNAKNAAYFMGIRDDIKDNPSHLSKANLSQVNNFTDPTQAIYQYELTDGNNNVLEKFLDLARSNVFFVSAGGLSSTEVTLSQYASNIIGFAATQNYSVNFLAEQSSSVRNALQDKLQNLRGVDINEEMVNMIIFQQSFAASAKAIQTANRIYDILFEAF
ncbi:MAG: flagellar basal body rod C-terminal domain-containing protein, partial [Alphaproteobacteria bacterium]